MNAEEILQYSLVVSNVNKNVNGGYYRRGVAKTLVEKIDVAAKWIEMSNDCENIPSIRALAKAAKVSRIFATKVVDELKEGQIIDPKSLVKDIPCESSKSYYGQFHSQRRHIMLPKVQVHPMTSNVDVSLDS